MKNADNTFTVACGKSKIHSFTSLRIKNILVFCAQLRCAI